jgi:cytochrome c oxidase cbb3-type subunit III
MPDREVDAVSGIETTGHSWDGIKELNNPLPRWWVWTFYATILFSIGYMIYYPAIPLIEGSTQGISGQTNRLALRQEIEQANVARQGRFDQIAASDLQSIKANENLYRFALAGGGSLFKVHCTQCHGSGAQGAPGYPNLNDDDWLWGGDLDSIYATISHGVRNDSDDEAHLSEMPAFGADQILDPQQITAVTEYVLQLSGLEHDRAMANEGKTVFQDNCVACHGEGGKGDSELGAPNLADAIWLYGSSRDRIRTQINRPRHGVMPAWLGRLGDSSVKQLTLYVHGLGGGQ